MCEMAPSIIYPLRSHGCFLLAHTGRTARLSSTFGGTTNIHLTALRGFDGPTLLYALENRRRFEVDWRVRSLSNGKCFRRPRWSQVVEDWWRWICRLSNSGLPLTPSLWLLVGGLDLRQVATNSTLVCTGSGVGARAINRVQKYANGEFIQVHPTSIPGEDHNCA